MKEKRNYPKDTPFWSFVTLAVLGTWTFIGARFVWRAITGAPTPKQDETQATS